MVSEPSDQGTALHREVLALSRAVAGAERRRDQRLEAKLAELDVQMKEAERIQKLITGGAAHREARLRALEDMVEAMAAERARAMRPRPLDPPERTRFDSSVIDMRSRDPTFRD